MGQHHPQTPSETTEGRRREGGEEGKGGRREGGREKAGGRGGGSLPKLFPLFAFTQIL